MYQDMPQRHVHDVLAELLHGDQPAGWPIIGSESNIRSFSREHFVSYRKDHYVSSATTVIVAGSFDEQEMITKIKKAFAGMSSQPKKAKLKVVESQHEPNILTEFKETDQTHLVIALRTFPVTDTRIHAMMVLSTILGAGMSSRLWSKMRDQLGICYYVQTSHNPFTDHGDLTISAGVDNARVKEGIQGILEECARLRDEIVSEAELKKAKDYIAGTTMLELETSDARAEFCASQEVLKHSVDSPADIIAKVNTVSAADVHKLAQEVFVNQGLNMALIGKFKDGSSFMPYFTF